jgi:hypothetical protein
VLRSFDSEKENLEEDSEKENLEEDNTTLQASPCQLVFGRDMIHNIAFKANWD